MSITGLIEKYKQLLRGLLPLGKLWETADREQLSNLLDSSAEELCRIEQRASDLINESDVRQADELIEDWERVLALPDECSPENQTLTERQAQATQKYTNVGGLSKTFYEFLNSQLGFATTVENRVNFLAGRGRAGDPLSNYFDRHFVAGSTAGEVLAEVGWLYYFNVEMPITAAEVFVAGSLAGSPLRTFENELIECTMKKLKPAHSGVFFTFS